jgi:5S rRNA maturation endonuclease (ribonuclease M5)
MARSGIGGTGCMTGVRRVLYRLPELCDGNSREPVIVVEGEKDVDNLAAIGIVATTSSGGAGRWDRTDSTPLHGRLVTVIPDNDESGCNHARDVCRSLAGKALDVRVLMLEGLPHKGDASDWIESRRAAGLGDDAIRDELLKLAGQAPAWQESDVHCDADKDPDSPGRCRATQPPTVARYRAFPTERLPRALARFVREQSQALNCDASMVAPSMLATCAGAIGTTRAIGLREDWREPAVVWAAIVSRSGTLKSPAFDAAVQPLQDAQAVAFGEHAEAMADYERELAKWESLSKKEKAQAEKPQPPLATRYVVSDCTVEALAPVLEHNPRGVLLARDELSGWVRSFDQYKGGKGSDLSQWLQLHRGGSLVRDRKTGDQRVIFVRRAAVSICGTIQPGVLENVMTGEHWEAGLGARLLLCRPPERRKRWTERAPSRDAVEGYRATVQALLRLDHATDAPGDAEPVVLPLTPDALTCWAEWYNRHADRQADANTDREAAVLAKLEAYAARFALIFALIENPEATAVGADAIRRGCDLAQWFADEAARLYGELYADDDVRERGELVRWIERQGGAVTARKLARGKSRYRESGVSEDALQGLVDVGLGEWRHPPPGPTGGHPSKQFVLHGTVTDSPPVDLDACGDSDTTPAGDTASGGNGTVTGGKSAVGGLLGDDADPMACFHN